ncbi:MAG TPA: hypothetical protein PL042_05080, partial [Caldisericia bacterium]|nr:hypothetical protein [Caldisericia bacterium]
LQGSSFGGELCKIISHHVQNGYLVSEALATTTVVTQGGASKYNTPVFNDCYWHLKEEIFDWCSKDDEHCVGMKKCKFYETEFQHKVRETIEKAENEET